MERLELGGDRDWYMKLMERPSEVDCIYYVRLGSCGYEERCHYNHPGCDHDHVASIQMKAVLTQLAVQKTLQMRPTDMTDDKCNIVEEIEELYMTKSLANKLRLKERLYTIHMSEGTSVQSHLNEFNSIIVDIESLDVKIDDEDKVILLVVSLPPSFKHFKEIMFYGNHTSLSFENVKSNLLSKEKFDVDSRSEPKGEGLIVRGSRDHKSNLYCRYCRKILIIYLSAPK